MQKQLPFQSNPFMKAFPYFANYFGIMEGKNYPIEGILYNHYITLSYSIWADYIGYLGETIIRRQFHRKWIKERPVDYLQFIKEQINEDKYITLILNAKYFNQFSINQNWYHDWLIYGYDDATQTVSIAGYMIDLRYWKVLEYKTYHLKYDEFIKSIPEKNETTGYEKSFMNNHICWLPENYVPEAINKNKVQRDLFFYAHNLLPVLFNTKVYEKYERRIKELHQGKTRAYDLRPLKILTEHKKVLQHIAQTYVPETQACSEICDMYKCAYTILKAATNYNMLHYNKEQSVNIIIRELKELHEKEACAVGNLLYELKRSNAWKGVS